MDGERRQSVTKDFKPTMDMIVDLQNELSITNLALQNCVKTVEEQTARHDRLMQRKNHLRSQIDYFHSILDSDK